MALFFLPSQISEALEAKALLFGRKRRKSAAFVPWKLVISSHCKTTPNLSLLGIKVSRLDMIRMGNKHSKEYDNWVFLLTIRRPL